MTHLYVFEAVLKVEFSQAADVARVLPGEPCHHGCEVQRERQLDQLRGRYRTDLDRRGLFLQVGVSQLLEGGVGHALEEVAQSGVLLQLGGRGREERAVIEKQTLYTIATSHFHLK